jgi:hypothetical protein
MARISRASSITCGSELARDEAITVDINPECQTAIASKLTPTLVLYFKP